MYQPFNGKMSAPFTKTGSRHRVASRILLTWSRQKNRVQKQTRGQGESAGKAGNMWVGEVKSRISHVYMCMSV